MALKLSTGFRTLLLGPYAFEDILRAGCIRIFSGYQPDDADSPEQGQLLGVVTAGGLPWSAGSPANGLLYNRSGIFIGQDTSRPWAFNALATGAAGWFRVVGNALDDGGANADAPRIDGAIGAMEDAPEMLWSTPNVSRGMQYPIDQFFFTLPPLPGT